MPNLLDIFLNKGNNYPESTSQSFTQRAISSAGKAVASFPAVQLAKGFLAERENVSYPWEKKYKEKLASLSPEERRRFQTQTLLNLVMMAGLTAPTPITGRLGSVAPAPWQSGLTPEKLTEFRTQTGAGTQTPWFQTALEDASLKGDYSRVRLILDQIPFESPYKTSMESLFRPKVNAYYRDLRANPITGSFAGTLLGGFLPQKFNIAEQVKALPEFLKEKLGKKKEITEIEKPRSFVYTPEKKEEEKRVGFVPNSEGLITELVAPLKGNLFSPDNPQDLNTLQEASLKAQLPPPSQPYGKNLIDRQKFDLAKQGQIAPSKTPQLYTEGNKIKRADTGEDVTLKGVTSEAFRTKGQKIPLEELEKRLNWVSDWGGNLLTLYVDPKIVKANIEEVDKVVDFAKDQGLYVDFAATPKNHILSQKDAEDFLGFLAQRYKDKTNIIYNVGVEPKTPTWKEWVEEATPVAKRIRKENPNAVLVMPGINAGRLVKPYEKELPFKNVIYSSEEYFWDVAQNQILNPGESVNSKFRNLPWADTKLVNYPIMVPEFGGYWGADFGSQTDLEVIHKMLQDIENRGFSFTMHSLDPHPYPNRGLGLIDEFGNLTKKGQEIKNHLFEYPATFQE